MICLAMLEVGKPLDANDGAEGNIRIVYLGLTEETRAGGCKGLGMTVDSWDDGLPGDAFLWGK